MKRLGGNLFFFGIGSMLLHLANMEFILLMWIDLWGPTVGWGIRITLAVVGGLMWFSGDENGGN